MCGAEYLRRTGLMFAVTSIFSLVTMIDANAQSNPPPDSLTLNETLDLLLKLSALLAGGGWFIYRVYSGYMTVNLGLEVKLNRSRQSNLENISVQIILKKGDQGKLDLYDIKARLRIAEDSSAVLPRPITFGNDVSIGEQYKIVDVSNIRRLTLAEGKKSLSFERYSAESPNLRLAPADEMIFSCLFQVPIDTTCIVDVAVLGRKAFGSRTGQWRSSLVSIPATVGPAPIGALND